MVFKTGSFTVFDVGLSAGEAVESLAGRESGTVASIRVSDQQAASWKRFLRWIADLSGLLWGPKIFMK
jgi:hypothetical protein